ncbi:hypothetical protein Barb4_00893 [Bacteroidales bacterium Barb4]|nr:hypothetical protein Barb4_00893 [Bacteroidales bacterium Barb4]
MRHIRLTEEERQELEHLYKTSLNSVVRERSFCLLLSNKGHRIIEIAEITNLCRQTVSSVLTAWESSRSEDKHLTLSTAPGRGAKIKINPVGDLLPQLIENHSHNLNPIPNELEKKYGVKVCRSTLQTF